MRVIKFEGKSLDTLTPALSLTGRGEFYDTLHVRKWARVRVE